MNKKHNSIYQKVVANIRVFRDIVIVDEYNLMGFHGLMVFTKIELGNPPPLTDTYNSANSMVYK